MAKKNKIEGVVLEDIELKPQVIGHTYQKKSNMGRVVFIFIVFLLVVFYINDISVFINDLIGKKSASSVEDLAGNSNNNFNFDNNKDNKDEVIYNVFSNDLTIKKDNFTLNNFNYINNILTFDIVNESSTKLNLKDKKYFIETYNENETLLERFKLDINTVNENSKLSFELQIKESFYSIVLEEKSISDYPVVNLEVNENNLGVLTCIKDIDNIVYTFKDNELLKIKHTISNSDINNQNYYTLYNNYQSKINTYNNITGMSATFNSTLNGFTAIIDIDTQKVDMSLVNEKYYYSYKEMAKVVKFEMQTYGFVCN